MRVKRDASLEKAALTVSKSFQLKPFFIVGPSLDSEAMETRSSPLLLLIKKETVSGIFACYHLAMDSMWLAPAELHVTHTHTHTQMTRPV